MLRVFNSMTRRKEDFIPLRPGRVGMYVCGVTTYDLCHVGHARVYVVFDTILRWLKRDHQVTYVRNFTDVDDKIIRRAHEANEDPLALAARYADEFHTDMDALGVRRADVEPRVSTHMPEIIAFIADLEKRGFAYRLPSATSDGSDVYFHVNKMDAARYLQLSGRSVEDMQAGARVAIDERKEDPTDFALWKSAKPGEIFWESPFGRGRPGWHIECSAMSLKHLGVTFDIHGGGRDLIFPHHTNEIAQSECLHGGEAMARYWMHNGFVSVELQDGVDAPADLIEEIEDDKGKKIRVVKQSKSLGNFFTIREVCKQFTPEALRLLLLSTHYRGPIAFSPRLLEEAESRLRYVYETKRKVMRYLDQAASEDGPSLAHAFKGEAPFEPMRAFAAAMEDDFNTAEAIAPLWELLTVQNLLVDGKEKERTGQKLKPAQRACLLREGKNLIEQMCAVLGVGENDASAFLLTQRAQRMKAKGILLDDVELLLADRAAAKSQKDYPRADAARDALLRMGVEVRDTPAGVDWSVG